MPPLSAPTTPHWQRHQALTPTRFRLFPFRSPLLRESLLLSLPRVTEMFQFTRFPLPALYIQAGVTPHDGCGVSPFGHPRIDVWSATPRGFSQPPTSFFGFRRQGIHRWLFVAWRTKMLVLAMEFSRGAPSPLLQRTRRGERPAGVDCSSWTASQRGNVTTPPTGPEPERRCVVAPSKRNSEVPHLPSTGIGGRPGRPSRGTGGPAMPPVLPRCRIASDRLGVPDRNDQETTP